MLDEIPRVRQIPGEPRRRWFTDEAMDLIAWYDEEGAVVGFQLAWGKGPGGAASGGSGEQIITWRRGSATPTHARVDDGERAPGHHKATPILLGGGTFDPFALAGRFWRRSERVPPELRELVARKLAAAGAEWPPPQEGVVPHVSGR